MNNDPFAKMLRFKFTLHFFICRNFCFNGSHNYLLVK